MHIFKDLTIYKRTLEAFTTRWQFHYFIYDMITYKSIKDNTNLIGSYFFALSEQKPCQKSWYADDTGFIQRKHHIVQRAKQKAF